MQKGDHLVCSAKALSPRTQCRSPMSQWKHVTLSKLPVMTKCLLRVKIFSTKLLFEGKEKDYILYNDVYVPRKKEASFCQRFGWWHSVLMYPRVERFESRIKQVVGSVCRRCPTLCRPQLYVCSRRSFKLCLSFLSCWACLFMSRCRLLTPAVSGGISRESWVCPMSESMTIPVIYWPVRSGREFGLTSMPLGWDIVRVRMGVSYIV